MQLSQGMVKSGIRKKFFNQRMAGHWKSLSREWSQHPAYLDFKKLLDIALRHLV